MTFPRPTSDTVAAIRAFLADPRFASASTLAAVGMAVSAQLIQNLINSSSLLLIQLVADINNVQQHVGLHNLLQRRLEGRNQLMRQALDKANGICQNSLLLIRQV